MTLIMWIQGYCSMDLTDGLPVGYICPHKPVNMLDKDDGDGDDDEYDDNDDDGVTNNEYEYI